MSTDPFPPVLREVVDDVTPFFERLDTGRFAVGLGGSRSKGLWDDSSDIDFRLYHDAPLPKPSAASETWQEYFQIVGRWAERGVVIDGIWCRTIAEVEQKVTAWLAGDITPEPIPWTIWGYHVLPDISEQVAVIDRDGVIASWHMRLRTYPEVVREAVLAKHLASLRYWRRDYHYRHKVERRDAVFLASLGARLVHDLIQVVCAVNRVLFPGDGNNLRVVEGLPLVPESFGERVTAALYPTAGATTYRDQRDMLLCLIDDVEAFVLAHG